MELERQFVWLPKPLANGKSATILDLVKEGKDNILVVKMGEEIYQLTIWGQVQNKLIDKFGKDTATWKGKGITFQVEQQVSTGKNILRIL